MLMNSCILFKNTFNSLLLTINDYYNSHLDEKSEEKLNVVMLKFYKILLNIMQHIDLFFGCDGPHYLNGSYNSEPAGINTSFLTLSSLKNLDRADSDELFLTLKLHNRSTPELSTGTGVNMKPVLSMTDINATASTTVNANANAITNANINANISNSALNTIIKQICSDTSGANNIASNILSLNNKYMLSMMNKAIAAYKLYIKVFLNHLL